MKNLALTGLMLVVVLLVVVTFIRHGSRVQQEAPSIEHTSQASEATTSGQPMAVSNAVASPPPTVMAVEQARQFAKMRSERYQEVATANANFRKAMATRYASERANPAWAADTEGRIADVMKGLQQSGGSAPADLAVDCKSSVCRINGTFTGQAQADAWVGQLMPMLGGVLGKSVVSRREAQGGIAIDIYSTDN